MQDTEELYADWYNAKQEAAAKLQAAEEAKHWAELSEQERREMQDDYILHCARELIKAIEKSGRKLSFEQDGKVIMPVTFAVQTFDHYDPVRLVVKNFLQGWEVAGDL